MKLSAKQKDVIKLMREGMRLSKTRYIGYSSVTLSGEKTISTFVNKNTFNSLYKKEVIYYSGRESNMTSNFHLTELGKTIEL